MKSLAAVLLIVLAPTLVCAQEMRPGWPALDPEKTESASVIVRDDAGVETSGKVLRLDPDAIVLMVGDVERRFEAARVTRIEKRGDSLRNGVIVGALVGTAFAMLGAKISDCPGSDPGGPCTGFRVATVLMTTAIGAGIDALVVGRTTLYESSGTPSSATWALRGRQFGIRFAVKWST
jgi:hypothetical protein